MIQGDSNCRVLVRPSSVDTPIRKSWVDAPGPASISKLTIAIHSIHALSFASNSADRRAVGRGCLLVRVALRVRAPVGDVAALRLSCLVDDQLELRRICIGGRSNPADPGGFTLRYCCAPLKLRCPSVVGGGDGRPAPVDKSPSRDPSYAMSASLPRRKISGAGVTTRRTGGTALIGAHTDDIGGQTKS